MTKIALGERHSIFSKILNEERAYYIYVPNSYLDQAYCAKRYPVLYLLDGDIHFNYVASMADFMSAGANGSVQIPELIVVAVETTDRTRDFTPTHSRIDWNGDDSDMFENSGGASAFIDFFKDEIIPHVDSNYRTLPYRILMGHSLGGLFVVHTLLAAPALFQAYIAIDPSFWWDDQWLINEARELLVAGDRSDVRLYLTLSNDESCDVCSSDILKDAGRKFAALPELMSPVSMVCFKLDYFEKENHGSVPLLSSYYGLLYIFEGFKTSFSALINKPNQVLATQKKISGSLDVEVLLPGKLISETGSYALKLSENIDKVIEIFYLNVKNYPDSHKAYDDLAKAYRIKGEYKLANECYEKSQHLKSKTTSLNGLVENKVSSNT